MSPKSQIITHNTFLGKHFVILDFKPMEIKYLNALLTLFCFPKGNNRWHEHLANAQKIETILTKCTNQALNGRLGVLKRTSYCNYIYVMMGKKK